MALADYRLCDVCGGKAFYDANLNNEFDAPAEDHIRDSGYKLDYLGDWAVLCRTCAKTHKCVIEPIDDAQETSKTMLDEMVLRDA